MPENDAQSGQSTKADEVTQIAEGSERPINKAVLLSNLMTRCGDTEAERALAIKAGKEALEIIDQHRLFYASGEDGRKAASLRGYVNGRVRRLEGKGLDYTYLLPFAAAYMMSALLGALIGMQIHFGYNTINRFQIRFPDARVFLAPLFAFLLVSPLRRLLSRVGVLGSLIVGLLSTAWVGVLYLQLGMPQSVLAALGLAVIPYVLTTFGSGASAGMRLNGKGESVQGVYGEPTIQDCG